ncbi:MAG: hypothetical protein WD151_15715 [Phycisphaeraceae bacterium]
MRDADASGKTGPPSTRLPNGVLWTVVALWTLGVLVVTLAVTAWLSGSTSRVTGEAYVLLESPRSESFDGLSVFAIGQQLEWPGESLSQTLRRWLDLEVRMSESEEDRWGERLDRRSLAPPGVTLTGPEADPNYPLDEQTLPAVLMQEVSLYPREGFEAEVAAVIRVMAWLGWADTVDPDDAATSREAFDERFEEELSALFDEVHYAPPRLHRNAAPMWVTLSPVVLGVLVWIGGGLGIRRWWRGPKPKGPIWV